MSGGNVSPRPFAPERIPAMVSVWNAAAGDAFPLREIVLRQNTVSDPHFDPAGVTLACEPGTDRVVGFVVAKVAREPVGADGLLADRGWISLLAVHPAAQRRKIGASLLGAAEEFLRGRTRQRAILGSDPGHFFPGVPDETNAAGFFAACGYALRGEAYDLRRSLRGYRTPESVEAALAAQRDVEIRPLAPGEEPALLTFLDAAFPGRWRYTIGRLLAGKAGETQSAVRTQPPGGPISDVMGVVHNGKVVGFAHLFHPGSSWIGPSIAWGPRSDAPPVAALGGLGPMGLAAELRGRGLGLALLDRSVLHLARLGVEEMVIDWTVLLDFYGRLGFAPWRRYRHGERLL